MSSTSDLVTILHDVAPEFKSEDGGRLGRFIGYATLSINTNFFGLKSNLATALLAAHYMTLANRNGTGGAVTEEKAKDLQVSYGAMPNAQELDTTSYGMMLKGLRKQALTAQIV